MIRGQICHHQRAEHQRASSRAKRLNFYHNHQIGPFRTKKNIPVLDLQATGCVQGCSREYCTIDTKSSTMTSFQLLQVP